MHANSFANAADLVSGMAARTGTDLSDPALTPRFRGMVAACRGCANPGGCAKLQAVHERLDSAPDYCRNKAVMNA